MKKKLQSLLVISVFSLILVAITDQFAVAQWQKISTLGLSPANGVLTYKAGVFWGADTALYMSLDSCKSWTRMGPFEFYPITGVDFFDLMNGVVCDNNDGVYVTHDGGVTWQSPLTMANPGSQVRFGTNVNTIFATCDGPGTANVSHDGGVTWSSVQWDNSSWAQDLTNLPDGSTVLFKSEIDTHIGQLLRSVDQGQSWQPLPGTTADDSWSIAVDSCDPNRLFIINEHNVGPQPGVSAVWTSTNGGQSWAQTMTLQDGEMSGTIATAPNSEYVGTTDKGVFRSTDRGLTWQSIGGPSSIIDSRQIVALSDNLIFAVDDQGDVYRTTNSGGDSLTFYSGPFALSTNSLFAQDTVLLCNTATGQIHFRSAYCGSHLDSVLIGGPDSSAFGLLGLPTGSFIGPDSIAILFAPSTARDYHATVTLVLADGSRHVIPLLGTGGAVNYLSLGTANVSTTILGDDVAVPIILNFVGLRPSCSFVLSYDTYALHFTGGKYATGGPITIDTESNGDILVVLDSAQLGNNPIVGYLHFNYFPTNSDSANVVLDSLSATGCTIVKPAISVVTYPYECGTATLTNFLLHDQMPQFSLSPNPSSGDVSLTSSENLGAVTIDIVDALGATVRTSSVTLGANSPTAIPMSGLATGPYFLRVQFDGMIRVLRVMREE
jgi:photosystem II stability/assembly factor-like uncharacterized protein